MRGGGKYLLKWADLDFYTEEQSKRNMAFPDRKLRLLHLN